MLKALRGRLAGLGLCAALALGAAVCGPVSAQEPEKAPNPLAGLKARLVGPAFTSGRISDFAFHPTDRHDFFVGTASGGLWHTTDSGTTWTPVFDDQGSYAIGALARNPENPNEIWAGTGENNAQRSVAYGDGLYRSLDGGKSWTKMGLENSGHISQIELDPETGGILVAAQGPLWSGGGDRGLYRSTDAGESWERILEVDEYTGVNEFVVHPGALNEIVASSYQRHRHVWTLINGGPGSGIWKTRDGGANWERVTAGLPSGPMGRIGLASAPSNPEIIYAIIEGMPEEQGVYRSTDFGETWEKRSSHMTTSPQYYNELAVDPNDPDRVYSMDTFTNVSEDGGKTWERVGINHRHVDDHAMWIDPDNSDHIWIGGDGGVYETWNRGQTWRHIQNLPLVQFYRIEPDEDKPFYNVYGGTQDNNSMGGPSRTRFIDGIASADWTIVLGGDGYKPQIDPTNPDIVYAQYQYGGLARYDRRTGERVFITPQPASGENAYKWNWNTPLLISPHNPKRIYYAAEKVFQSDDRGDSWRAISPDITRQLDRNALDVMGRVWSVDAIAKNDSTSIYGAAIALDESPLKEGLIYVGSDDGLIHVTEDGGETWRKTETFPTVPDQSLVEDIIASVHDENVAYAVFDNHKRGDYKPYVLKTIDKGRTWTSITGDLPDWGSAHTIAQDHVDPDLLFVGTEFGLFVSQEGGGVWHRMKNGLPTIAVRDLEIQRRENDLIIGTFGRGIYIVDDYTPLRTAAADLETAEATLLSVKDPLLYIVASRWGYPPHGSQGDNFYTAENPPYGAVFRYYLRDGYKSLRDSRLAEEADRRKEGGDNPYPSWDDLRAEDREDDPAIILTVTNGDGEVVRRMTGPARKGLHQVAWDLRWPAPNPIELASGGPRAPWASAPQGPLALPGTYTVSLAKRGRGETVPLGAPQSFTVKALPSEEATRDRPGLLTFQQKTAELQRAVLGAAEAYSAMGERVAYLNQAALETPGVTEAQREALAGLEDRLYTVGLALNGDRTIRSRNEPAPWSIRQRVGSIVGGHWNAQAPVTGLHRRAYDIAAAEFETALEDLKAISADLVALEAQFEAAGAPWTPGRLPDWQKPSGR